MAFVLASISHSLEDGMGEPSLRACAGETATGPPDLSWAVTLDCVCECLVPCKPRRGKEAHIYGAYFGKEVE